ncbi:MAG: rRNA maturation RNase YbeY [Pseudomonadota bacterium]
MSEHELLIRLDWEELELASEEEFSTWLEFGLKRFSLPAAAVGLSLGVVDAAQSQALNLQFRQKDQPTNVLAFPAGPLEAIPGEVQPLGDIIVCGPVLVKEAQEQGKPLEAHTCHLCLHGLLHLLGFDHQTQAQALEMEAEERQILAEFGFPDPYNRA